MPPNTSHAALRNHLGSGKAMDWPDSLTGDGGEGNRGTLVPRRLLAGEGHSDLQTFQLVMRCVCVYVCVFDTTMYIVRTDGHSTVCVCGSSLHWRRSGWEAQHGRQDRDTSLEAMCIFHEAAPRRHA